MVDTYAGTGIRSMRRNLRRFKFDLKELAELDRLSDAHPSRRS
jgi:hypothetical protein